MFANHVWPTDKGGIVQQDQMTPGHQQLQTSLNPAGTGQLLGGQLVLNDKPLQSKFLKSINGLTGREELFNYVERCHHLLDAINLVTCLYRLARIYSALHVQEQKNSFRAELQASPAFTLLLSSIHAHLMQAQAQLYNPNASPGTVGVNARCLSNLIWSMVKLEVTAEDGHSLALQVVSAASPLVLHFLEECSGQGLANLLWSYAKIDDSSALVMTAIVQRIVQLLQEPHSSSILDAQALSNSIWAIAHVQSHPRAAGSESIDVQPEWQEAVTSFLLLMANQCLALLNSLLGSMQVPRAQPQVVDSDQSFSCQVIVTIAWSFSTILGSACGVEEPMRPLFLLIRQLVIAKLRSTTGGMPMHQAWMYSLSGSFNEQALSNLVYAYDKAGLLSAELLQAVLDCSALKLSRCCASQQAQNPLGFKPQELCVLLRACQLGLAQPWNFLSALNRLLTLYPSALNNWSTSETADLSRALQLLRTQVPVAVQNSSGLSGPGLTVPEQRFMLPQQGQVYGQAEQAGWRAHTAQTQMMMQAGVAGVTMHAPAGHPHMQGMWLSPAVTDSHLQPSTQRLLHQQLSGNPVMLGSGGEGSYLVSARPAPGTVHQLGQMQQSTGYLGIPQ